MTEITTMAEFEGLSIGNTPNHGGGALTVFYLASPSLVYYKCIINVL